MVLSTFNANQIHGIDTAAEVPTSTRSKSIVQYQKVYVNLQRIGKIHHPLYETSSLSWGKSLTFNAKREDRKDRGS